MKKFILGTIFGLLISGGVVFASKYLYKADEVSYTPKDTTWNVDNVDSAIHDLYSKTDGVMKIPTETLNITANGNNIDVTNYAKVNVNVNMNHAIYLGTSNSYNIKSLYPNIYDKLTVDNFIVEYPTSKMEPSNWDTLAYFYNQTSYGYVSWNVSKNYNPSTGVFSCSANAQSIRRNSDLGYITVYPTPSVWLVTNLN